jgi:hypothetical protein
MFGFSMSVAGHQRTFCRFWAPSVHDPCGAPRHSDGYTGLVVPERKKSNGGPLSVTGSYLVAVAVPISKSWA